MLFSDVDYIYTINIHIVMLFSDVEYNTIFIPYCDVVFRADKLMTSL